MTGKKAVVLSGGGAKGGYHIGVWKALREIGYDYEIVMGTSVGALNGALMAMHRYDIGCKVWENMSMQSVFQAFKDEEPTVADIQPNALFKEIISKKGADYTPLQETVRGFMDEKALRNSDVAFGLVTTRLHPFERVPLFVEDIPDGEIADYILASAAFFPVMQKYEINGTAFVDGGFFDNLPVDMALQKGATEIVVVDLGGSARKKKLSDCPAKIHYVSNRIGLTDGPFGESIYFNKQRSLNHIRLGYLDTLKAFGRYGGYYYCLENRPQDSKVMNHYAERCAKLFERCFSGLPSVSYLESASQKSVLSYLQRFVEKPFMNNSNVLNCMESAAELLQINYLDIYTVPRLIASVTRDYKKLARERTQEADRRAQRQMKSWTLARIATVSAEEKQDVAMYLTRLLLADHLPYKYKRHLWLAGLRAPKTLCAAIFIAAALTEQANLKRKRALRASN